MNSQAEVPAHSQRALPPVAGQGRSRIPALTRGRILLIEDEQIIRESMGPLLEDEGYEVTFAENGVDALTRLRAESLPDLIVLDLRMPLMDGWEFRSIQKDDPRLGRIPVVAISADGSAQAAAISAQAYLRKPVGPRDLLATVERVLLESRRQAAVHLNETERLAALGRLAAGVGHEINNPLTFVMLNLGQALDKLRPAIRATTLQIDDSHHVFSPDLELPELKLSDLKLRLADVIEMLEDCQVGGERIRESVHNLKRLSRKSTDHRGPVDVHQVIEQAASAVWNQIRHRARLIKCFGKLPTIQGNQAALEQVFVNLLLNAAQAIPEGHADQGEIRVVTKACPGPRGPEILVEVSDSGGGISSGDLAHVFEPFFTTKPMGEGAGLGLSISRQTVTDHGGRLSIESQVGRGTTCRVWLPIGEGKEVKKAAPSSIGPVASSPATAFRGRLLVIDDEPLLGRVIRTALRKDYEVDVVTRASEALQLFEDGKIFDLVLCDVVMPDLSGPELYATVAERWPGLRDRLVFMTGGTFTPETAAFIERVPTRVLSKPFKIELLQRLVRERIRGHA